jgi:gluconokinase
MILVLMGVAGSGKTTVGVLLGHRLKWPFHDTDDLHPPANRDKMSRGIALTDEDRRRWLQAVRALICRLVDANQNAVVACSALKSSYREQIAVEPSVVRFVYLKGSPSLIAERLAGRQAHFFRRDLLQSQFDTLEEPNDAIVIDIAAAPAAIVDSIIARLDLKSTG